MAKRQTKVNTKTQVTAIAVVRLIMADGKEIAPGGTWTGDAETAEILLQRGLIKPVATENEMAE